MPGVPERQWRPGLLTAIEAEFFALRRCPPMLDAAFAIAFAYAAGAEVQGALCVIRSAGERLIAATEAAVPRAELAYHNRHHVAEAVLAMGWLCGMARRADAISAEAASLGVVAMVGHDLLHDGSPPNGGGLEARSAAAVADAIDGIALDARQRAVIRAVILGTDPRLVAANAARRDGERSPGALGRTVDLVISMANEADIFASLLPSLGWHLTYMLARERRDAGHAGAAELADNASRLAFLSTYARLSPAAQGMGLAELRRRQAADCARLCNGGGTTAAHVPERVAVRFGEG